MRKYAVIMAGGSGTRFWPKSRKGHPKQFLNIGGSKSLIRETFERLDLIVKPENTYVVINRSLSKLARQQLPEIPDRNFLVEPVGKNTAACIALAAYYIARKDPDGVMFVLPADHKILDKNSFIASVTVAFKVAEAGENLITFGIVPEHAETGYGYIEMEKECFSEIAEGILQVKAFKEKPGPNTAWHYFSSGSYLWNSGMFVWSIASIVNQLEKHLPETAKALSTIKTLDANNIDEYLGKTYTDLQSISIDHAIMEKADNVFVIKSSFGWSDVGSWRALEKMIKPDAQKNAIEGDVIAIDSEDNIVIGNKRLISLLHINDLVIVDTDDALLICPREKTQDVRQVVEELKKRGQDHLI